MDFERYLVDQIQQIDPAWLDLPVIMCGMAGSSIGWQEVPYEECPLAVETLAENLVPVASTVLRAWIVPGVRVARGDGLPDFMRGEETQVVGWLAQMHSDSAPRGRLCLPGTHSKWVAIAEGRLQNLATAFTGELFATLAAHSLLVQGNQAESESAFYRGLKASRDSKGVMSALFSARALVLAGEISDSHTRSYLSGLLIGSELDEQLRAASFPIEVHLIGSHTLNEYYRRALAAWDVDCHVHDGADLAAHGLWILAQRGGLFTCSH
ncbi:2-dehydro-3-deoxygalactonokinase [Microbulbifer agarilyticus]